MTKQTYTTLIPEKSSDKKQLRSITNVQNMIKIFEAFKKYQLQSGKANDSPEVLYIDKKIREFKNDLMILIK